jgi:shikimate dehydrogenase
MYKLAVVGNPIEHSLSPLVFELFARQFSLNLSYSKILAKDAADFRLKVEEFFKQDGLALNITSPFKQLAYEIATARTTRANFCGAANFIRKQDNELIANTVDGIGLVQDIQVNKQFKMAAKKILIIGSGFVLDSILLDIIAQNPAQISILARNEDRILYLKQKFALLSYNPETCYDIVFNSTPNSADNLSFAAVKLVSDGALCYDLTYNNESLFLRHMNQLNPTVYGYNGLGMLVEQATLAFTTLFNYEPDTALTLRQLAKLGYK